MDFFKEAQQLTQAAEGIVQEGTKNLIESVEEVKSVIQQSSATLDRTINSVKTSVVESAVQAEVLKQQSTQSVQRGIEGMGETIDNAKQVIFELGLTGSSIADVLKDLPKTAEELAKEMPKIATRLRRGAGLRVGDAPRSNADVMKLFRKIPGTSQLKASEAKIREFLTDRHGSHIISRKNGGSNDANNIVWEIGAGNVRRGARTMTGGERIYIRFYNAVDSILENSGTVAKLGVKITATAVITQAVVTAISYALDLYRGDITVEEFRERVVEASVTAGIATPVFYLIFIVVLALVPELTVLLSTPIVIAGFNALFGISIAIPIIRSLIRHVEAGGFGEEIEEGYQAFVDNK